MLYVLNPGDGCDVRKFNEEREALGALRAVAATSTFVRGGRLYRFIDRFGPGWEYYSAGSWYTAAWSQSPPIKVLDAAKE